MARGIALQSSCWFSAVSFITGRIPPQVACVVVVLHSRIYDVIPLPKMSDVLGPICSGYVPFHPWKSVSLQLFSRVVEVAWLIDLSDMLKRPSDIIDTRSIDLKRNRNAVP